MRSNSEPVYGKLVLGAGSAGVYLRPLERRAAAEAMLDKLLAARITRRRCSSCASSSSACSISACISNTARKRRADPADAGGSGKKMVAVVPSPSWGRFPHAFSHIFAGGYAAGYHSYLWAEVLSADAYSRFEEEDFQRRNRQSFLDNILSRGRSEEPMTLFKRFRGREPQLDAMLRHYGIKDSPTRERVFIV